MTIQHDYFDKLNTQKSKDVEVIWQKDIEFNNQVIDTVLWLVNPNFLTQQNLDKFANFLKNLAKIDTISRQKLKNYLEEDNEFIELHIDEIEGSEIIENLGDNPSVDEFVKAMSINHISMWLDDNEDYHAYLDYVIDDECSDQILAVRFDIDGNFVEIAWES